MFFVLFIFHLSVSSKTIFRTEETPVQNETLVSSASPLISNLAEENTSSPGYYNLISAITSMNFDDFNK